MEPELPTTPDTPEDDEPPRRHEQADPEDTAAEAIEDTRAYESAVQDDTTLPPSDQQDPGAGDLAPPFQEPT